MSATRQRDQVAQLAKTNPKLALELARGVKEPWFRAQALSWAARFTDEDPLKIALEAARAADACNDAYKRAAARAWEIAALAERGSATEARKSLKTAVSIVEKVQPMSSRGEAALLLLQAGWRIDKDQAKYILEILARATNEHWRCKRAHNDARQIYDGEREPREFFW